MTASFPFTERLLFGAAFYDEYRVGGTLERDLDLMKDAGFSVIRVGESVWSSWEPRPGEFDLDWLEPVLDGAAERGIAVILGTPTYAVPQWLRRLDPDIAADIATGVPMRWGSRQEINYLNPVFRTHAERVVRRILERYADHPAVVGFQVDNEPGLHLLHNADVFAGFVDYLRDRYGSVDELNRAWGLVFWSHLLREWDDLWAPDGNHSPQYALEWRRYQSRVVADFIGWQADIVREYASPGQFVTTCISYERPAVDDVAIVEKLDIAAGNPYYKMQDGLHRGVDIPRPVTWWSAGVWGLYEQADRMYSTAQGPFLVTETNAQSIGQSHWENHPPYPGQIALSAFALIARGARMVEYWQWQTLAFGIETYWGGVLPHSGVPGRIYREIADLGRRIGELEPILAGYVPDADVTFLYSTDTKRFYEFYPPLATASGEPDRDAYLQIFDAFYRGAFDAGLQSRIIHAGQLLAGDPAAFAANHPVLVVPTLYVADDHELAALTAYAAAGGHLIVGIRSGYGDALGRARYEVAPGALAAPAGIVYDEYTNLDIPVSVRSTSEAAAPLDGVATGWADAIEPAGAMTLATYGSGIYAGRPAITTSPHGDGRVTYVGTVPDLDLASGVLRWAAPVAVSTVWDAPGATISSGISRGTRVWFVSNWSGDRITGTASVPLQRAGSLVDAGTRIELAPWSVEVFLAGPHPV